MGYDQISFQLFGRVERHNGPGDKADDAAFQRFCVEVQALIDSDRDYLRIFNYGDRLKLDPVG